MNNTALKLQTEKLRQCQGYCLDDTWYPVSMLQKRGYGLMCPSCVKEHDRITALPIAPSPELNQEISLMLECVFEDDRTPEEMPVQDRASWEDE